MTNSQPAITGSETGDDALVLWIQELVRHLEVEGIDLDLDAVQEIAAQAAQGVNPSAGPATAFLIGYVAGLAEASGQADFAVAHRAATRVAQRLLDRRSAAVG